MGMGEKKERAKAFKQKTAEVLTQELHQPDLFTNKTIDTEYLVECIREFDDVLMVVGDHVKLVDMRNSIDVFSKTVCVGSVITSQITTLRERYQLEARASRSISGQVKEISAFGNTFIVAISL